MEIPFKKAKGFLSLQVTVNGSADLNLLLDTGAPNIALFDTPATKPLNLSTQSVERFDSSPDASTITAQTARGLTFDFRGLILRNHSAAVVPLDVTPCASTIQASGIDGVIGYDLLRRYVVEIDFDRDVMTLHEPGTYTHQVTGKVVPLLVRNFKPVVMATWTNESAKQIPLELHLDTASSAGLEIYAKGRPGLTAPSDAHDGRPNCMLGGLVPKKMGGSTSVMAGPVTWSRLTTTYVASMDDPWDGVLGAGARAEYNVIFDYAGRRLVLEQRAVAREASEPRQH